MTLIQTEPKKIYYGGPTTESDMKGPCPVGFHVPTESELRSITSAGRSMGAWTYRGGINISTYLKMPHAGCIGIDGKVSASGNTGYYWTCTAVNGNNTAKLLMLYNDTATERSYPSYGRMYGGSIRPIKNTSVSPDSTRTVLYGSLGSDGIFWNSTLGLISLVYNGNTYTIADKNLGATTVYNYGDTLSADNCGGFFQWGNNYMFPYSGPTKKSTTMVSAADYGPGNYYSSDTFIYSSSGYNTYWDTSNNLNLWGGTTQGTFQFQREIKTIYLGTTQVRPTVQPIETEDIAATSYNQTLGSDPSNYYGVVFKALKSGTITKVKFLYQSSHTGTLKIATGTNATAAGTTYTLTTSNTSGGEYTLLSPFEITAGTTYNIAVAPTSTCGYLSGGAGFPATRTAVQYTSGVIGNDSSSYSQMVFVIKSLIIEYLPD